MRSVTQLTLPEKDASDIDSVTLSLVHVLGLYKLLSHEKSEALHLKKLCSQKIDSNEIAVSINNAIISLRVKSLFH